MSDVEIEVGGTNVYADLGMADAGEMLVKSKLAMKINAAIKAKKLTQSAAAELTNLAQPKLSGLLRGIFRGISETKMIDCLNRLGQDVDIVVRPARTGHMGHVNVVFPPKKVAAPRRAPAARVKEYA
jgi:predicted XRE-type DNA-binding protein